MRTNSRDNIPGMRQGLPNGLQASNYGARKVIGTTPNTNSITKIIKEDIYGVETQWQHNKTSSCVGLIFKE